jgi:TatA/E family protein of Tat protein translocase
MDFFGVGPVEIILILVIALIVFGPDKLPQIGRDLGKTFRSFKKAASDLSAEMSKEMKDLEEKGQERKDDSKQVETRIVEVDKISKPEAGDNIG